VTHHIYKNMYTHHFMQQVYRIIKTEKQNYDKLETHGLRTRDTRKSGDRVENTEHTETMDIPKYRAR